MITESITDIKTFMSALLIGDAFDRFLVTDITLTSYNTFHIDGHIKKAFFSPEEYEAMGSPELSAWKDLKPICYQLIKGRRTPLSFKMIFCLSKEDTVSFLAEQGLTEFSGTVNGLFVNIKYENGTLSYVTGTSLSVFTVDKTLEHCFDKYISKIISTLF